MKVRTLIRLLQGMDENADVLLASDPSGNEYLPLSSIDEPDKEIVDENVIVLYPCYEL